MIVPQILDCTIRDGGYLNNWRFAPDLVREVYRSASKAGVDYVELGYHGSRKFFDPDQYGLWRFTPETALAEAVAGIQGAKVSVMIDSGRFDPADMPPRAESVAEMVRVAAHRDKLGVAMDELAAIKAKGYATSLQLMGYSGYSPAERDNLRALLEGAPVDYAYVADSYGSMYPHQIAEFLAPLQGIPGIKVGFHPHNQLQMAFANSLEAIRCGVDIVDATLYGIGRAAGNLPLEILVAYFQERLPDRFSVLPLLNTIDRHFIALKREKPWGYQLPFMLSGLLDLHPSYSLELSERREHTIEEIWTALRGVRQRGGVGFSRQVLDQLLASGMVGGHQRGQRGPAVAGDQPEAAAPQPPVTYQDRHQGRDFLILATGPSLREYSERVSRFIAKHDPVVLGANYLGDLFAPHYHAFANRRRFSEYVGRVNPNSRLLLASHFDQDFIREYTDRDFEWLVYHNRLADFDLNDGVISTSCRTVSVLLCGLALVMGARRIFVVGMDGYLGAAAGGDSHFYQERDETSRQEVIREKHEMNLRYLRQIHQYAEARGLEGLHILTPTAYQEFYKGISNYLD